MRCSLNDCNDLRDSITSSRSAHGSTCLLDSRGLRSRSGNVEVYHPIALNLAGGSKASQMNSDCMAIYVVDDHAAMRKSLDALLGSVGFTTQLFASGEEFLAAAEDLEPGILLTDLRMSGMDGLDLVSCLKTMNCEFPAIIMTAHGDIDAAIRALRLGARDFIQKPFREAELLAIIDREAQALQSSGTSDAVKVMAQLKLEGLTPRELEVVQGLALGKTNKTIAHELALSTRTVEMHRSRAMDRLGCRNIAELMAIALHGDILGMSAGGSFGSYS